MLGKLVKQIFGSGEAGDQPGRAGKAVEYNGFTITPRPKRQGSQFLTAGSITKDYSDGPKQHDFIRADTHGSEDEAQKFSVLKAQQIIDQMGDRLFS